MSSDKRGQALNNTLSHKIYVDGLSCEHQFDKAIICTKTPRFYWLLGSCNEKLRNLSQKAYQIIVSETVEEVYDGRGVLWDTGKIFSEYQQQTVYSGLKLKSGTTYYAAVRVWDTDDHVTPWSSPLKITAALLNQGDWAARWITTPIYHDSSPMFRKDFNIPGKPFQANVFISAAGVYRLSINGKRVGKGYLGPAWTEYSKRILYEVYDVSNFLKIGYNTVGIILGDGRWRTSMYKAPEILFELRITYQVDYPEGNTQKSSSMTISSNTVSNWKVTHEGPIRSSSIYDGEIYDACRIIEGWDSPHFTLNQNWKSPLSSSGPEGMLVYQNMEPIEIVDQVKPVKQTEPIPGVYVFDFGKNIAGRVRVHLRGEKGQKLLFKYSEILHDNGTVNQINLRTAKARDIFYCRGGEEETWEPEFTYHGYRYVQVEGLIDFSQLLEIQSVIMRTAVTERGLIKSSDETLNRIYDMCKLSEAGNLHGIPTDCPQRDERLGWLNDMTARTEALIHHFSVARFLTKWHNDIRDAQDKKNGAITDTAPFSHFGRKPADPVSSSFLLIPWLLYMHYEDREIIADSYEDMKQWVDYLRSQSDDGIIDYSYFGDWASPKSFSRQDSIGAGAVSLNTPGSFVSTVFYYLDVVLMCRFAQVLGRINDLHTYTALAEKIKLKFNNVFFNPEAGYYSSGSQTSSLLPLAFGLVPEKNSEVLKDHLLFDIIHNHKKHLTTGNQGTKYILEVLSEVGETNLAYEILTNSSYPGWKYMLDHGATTTWERWEYVTEGALSAMASHNHPMNASIAAWMYTHLGGIQAHSPGFRQIKIKPYIPEKLHRLHVELMTLRGKILLIWKQSPEKIEITVSIPVGSQAYVWIPLTEKRLERKRIMYENSCCIWEENSSVKKRNETSPVWKQHCKIPYAEVFSIGSGSYHFISTSKKINHKKIHNAY